MSEGFIRLAHSAHQMMKMYFLSPVLIAASQQFILLNNKHIFLSFLYGRRELSHMTIQINEATIRSGLNTDPNKWSSIGVLLLFSITLPVILAIVVISGPPTSVSSGTAPMLQSTASAHPMSAGESVYKQSCMVCHGPSADGVVGLGKPLRNSAYVLDSDDAELFSNIAEGRAPDHPLNTTGIMMPARGAQNISDDQINDVITYLRSIQDSTQPRASVDAWVKEESAVSEMAFSGPGHDLYVSLCSSCHGPNGEGLDGLGKPFTTSEFVKDSTDKEIIMMVKMGRPIWDAANTSGIDMPPKGGNPAMSDDELNDIIAYIRSISTLE
jgi:cbb3-type cytochrome c oxidase subunit III